MPYARTVVASLNTSMQKIKLFCMLKHGAASPKGAALHRRTETNIASISSMLQCGPLSVSVFSCGSQQRTNNPVNLLEKTFLMVSG